MKRITKRRLIYEDHIKRWFKQRMYSEAKSVYDIAKDISEGLARVACAGEVDGEVVDLRTVIDHDCALNILTPNDKEGLRVIRHTASHVLAEAVKRLFPEAKADDRTGDR